MFVFARHSALWQCLLHLFHRWRGPPSPRGKALGCPLKNSCNPAEMWYNAGVGNFPDRSVHRTKAKPPELPLRGSLVMFYDGPGRGCCRLLLPVQPFTDAICNHTGHDGKHYVGNYRPNHNSTPPSCRKVSRQVYYTMPVHIRQAYALPYGEGASAEAGEGRGQLPFAGDCGKKVSTPCLPR